MVDQRDRPAETESVIWDNRAASGDVMTEADQKREDDVLRRMLATKPQPHKSLGNRRGAPKKGLPPKSA